MIINDLKMMDQVINLIKEKDDTLSYFSPLFFTISSFVFYYAWILYDLNFKQMGEFPILLQMQ